MRCRECGSQQAKWSGKCPQCGAWDSLDVEAEPAKGGKASVDVPPLQTAPLRGGTAAHARYLTGLSEVDRALGGGIVHGSVVLLSGPPGIGKSTLLLQLAAGLAASAERVVYISGEETAAQVHSRADRLGIHVPIEFAAEADARAIGALLATNPPKVLIVDSVQTLTLPELPGTPGSIQQVRAATEHLRTEAKRAGTTLLLVGHVTKDGMIAGPKMLEHMVDVVCTIEGDRAGLRLIRCTKNRYGPAHEVGVLELDEAGVHDVPDPARFFLEQRSEPVAGVALGAAMDDQRLFVVEVQALVRPSALTNPRRVVQGVDARRVDLLLAVLERHAGVKVGNADVFVALSGGASFEDPGLDVAVAAAIASSAAGIPLPPSTVLAGEVSLTGEVRAPSHAEHRLMTLATLGFQHVHLPRGHERHALRELLATLVRR